MKSPGSPSRATPVQRQEAGDLDPEYAGANGNGAERVGPSGSLAGEQGLVHMHDGGVADRATSDALQPEGRQD